MSHRNPNVLGEWGPRGRRVVAAESYWRQPLRWDKEAEKSGERRRVFCASLADVFESEDTMPRESRLVVDHARRRLFNLIDATPHLDWLLLTKRPENFKGMLPAAYIDDGGDCDSAEERRFFAEGRVPKVLPNAWLGVSVENQATADERIPQLLQTPAAVRFLSCEPLLGPVDLSKWLPRWFYECQKCLASGDSPDRPGDPCGAEPAEGDGPECSGKLNMTRGECGLHWVIVGGESGHDARPMHPDWARSLRDQCRAAGVPFFFKQWGESAPACQLPATHPRHHEAGTAIIQVGKKSAGHLLDGVEWHKFPQPQVKT